MSIDVYARFKTQDVLGVESWGASTLPYAHIHTGGTEMSRLWNAYEDAVATFAAAGRLVEYDDSGAVVTVNGDERLLEPATLVTAAMMMAKNGVVANVYTSHSSEGIEGASEGGIDTDDDDAYKELARLDMRFLVKLVSQVAEWELEGRLTHKAAREICADHADQLAGTVWEEVFCPVCEASNTASGELDANERRHTMNFHDCPVLNRKSLFAGPDGYCRHCRSVELAAQILDRDVEELTGPTFEELLDQVGGEEAYRASLEEIRHVKHNGRPGNSVSGRVPRELLNLILTQHPMFINDLLDEYRAFAGKYGIALRHDPDGVLFHDYAALVQPAFPEMAPALNRTWQANVAEKLAMRNAFVESVRTSRQIVMSWVSSDGTESGVCALGPNTEETRLIASEYQAAARKKGFRTRFSLVQG
jgi:hypothetical protein